MIVIVSNTTSDAPILAVTQLKLQDYQLLITAQNRKELKTIESPEILDTKDGLSLSSWSSLSATVTKQLALAQCHSPEAPAMTFLHPISNVLHPTARSLPPYLSQMGRVLQDPSENLSVLPVMMGTRPSYKILVKLVQYRQDALL